MLLSSILDLSSQSPLQTWEKVWWQHKWQNCKLSPAFVAKVYCRQIQKIRKKSKNSHQVEGSNRTGWGWGVRRKGSRAWFLTFLASHWTLTLCISPCTLTLFTFIVWSRNLAALTLVPLSCGLGIDCWLMYKLNGDNDECWSVGSSHFPLNLKLLLCYLWFEHWNAENQEDVQCCWTLTGCVSNFALSWSPRMYPFGFMLLGQF